MLLFFKRYWKTIIVLLVIFYLSAAPASTFAGIPSFPNEDKLVHFMMYFGFALMLFWEYSSTYGISVIHQTKTVLLIIGIPAIWGGSMELFQLFFTTTRDAEWLDELADAIGATAGYFIGRWLLAIYYNHKAR
ncbi:VanZ family protein [Microbacter margulisiae]|uniref:VanZ family protein n=1 Tax=Microbacter margulisiae TaxID=1350067 RepID=A0A7W5H1N5_9PORP|nr:VanZ family protein [Microbacter margulisiae]MBB3186875.1 VanZ family protein [Microbacter margulisiae]